MVKLTATRRTEEVCAVFQDEEVPIFLISLKAGGVGLNLTAADTVIHYDPWWNPAVENQARIARIVWGRPRIVRVQAGRERAASRRDTALAGEKSRACRRLLSGCQRSGLNSVRPTSPIAGTVAD